MKRRSPLPIRTILLALTIAAMAGLTDWALVMPDRPLEAGVSTLIASGSATAFILPLLI